ncbi:hypothetical protein BH11PSE13_BH11PSE13_35520 [soil metagenome]
MSCLPDDGRPFWAVVGPERLLEAVTPLIQARGRDADVIAVPAEHVEPNGHIEYSDIARIASGLGPSLVTVLVLEDPACDSIRSRFASPFFERADGPDALLGWLRLDVPELTSYARRAVELIARGQHETVQTVVLLGPRERRFLELHDELELAVSTMPAVQTFRWSAERIRREPLVRALSLGAAALMYTGHGSAHGWLAYGGLNAEALSGGFDGSADQASALLFSLSCRTGQTSAALSESHPRARPAFADGVIARGVAGTVLAPFEETLHQDNRLLAKQLLRAIGSGHASLFDILDAARSDGAHLAGYTVVGDPALRALAAHGARLRGEQVFAPAADFALDRS